MLPLSAAPPVTSSMGLIQVLGYTTGCLGRVEEVGDQVVGGEARECLQRSALALPNDFGLGLSEGTWVTLFGFLRGQEQAWLRSEIDMGTTVGDPLAVVVEDRLDGVDPTWVCAQATAFSSPSEKASSVLFTAHG